MASVMDHKIRLTNRLSLSIKVLALGIFVIGIGAYVFGSNIFMQSKFITNADLKHKCKNYNRKFISEKWIIVTSINGPTADLKRLSTIKGWKLLVVGDRKTPKDWRMPDVEFLSIDKQYKMGYKIVKNLPEGTYTRKMTGYLYAIQHGAKYIYETDDDNSPWPKLDLSAFYLDPQIQALVVDSPVGAYNPLAHFGQSSIWPRGYPLDKISADQPRKYYRISMKTPTIQQGVVNGDPDVDAIYRLTRKHGATRLNVTFDPFAPSFVLQKGSLTSYNCQNTMILYDAFWSMFLPPSRTFRVLDIWRSYWAQRLMWLVDQQLMYVKPSAFQFRSPHNFLDDFRQEAQLYDETGDLVDFLVKWRCNNNLFYDCVSQISHDMVTKKFWAKSDANLIDAWLSDLQDMCYIPPTINPGKGPNDFKDLPREIFYPVEQETSVPNNPKTIILPPLKISDK